VDATVILQHLVDLGEEAGIRVDVIRDAEGPLDSGMCRVGSEIRVLLHPADPLENRIALVARALRTHATDLLATRYLPPAIRERLEA
jgi:hypothetical protein